MTPFQITAVRRRAGLSQAEFAANLGVSHGTVKSWETGRTTPSALNRAKIIAAEDLPRRTPSGMRKPASAMKPNLPPEALEIKERRLSLHLTINEVARVAEMAPRTILNYETGVSVPSKIQMIGLRVCIDDAGRLKLEQLRRQHWGDVTS